MSFRAVKAAQPFDRANADLVLVRSPILEGALLTHQTNDKGTLRRYLYQKCDRHLGGCVINAPSILIIPNSLWFFFPSITSPILRINSLSNKPMNCGVLPILGIFTQSMSNRIIMNIITMNRKIPFITD